MIHYLEVALRIEYDPGQVEPLLARVRQYIKETQQVPVNDDPDDETCRPMTDEEVAEDVEDIQSCILPILEMNPYLEQWGLSIIGSVTCPPRTAERIQDTPPVFTDFD